VVVADPASPSSISAALDLAAWILKSFYVPLAVKVAAEAEDLLSVGGGMILAASELFIARNTRGLCSSLLFMAKMVALLLPP
jgi:hypothetical protein